MILKALLGLVFTALTSSCEPVNHYFGLEDDNWIEESSEALIKYETGVSIDLTPSSPE